MNRSLRPQPTTTINRWPIWLIVLGVGCVGIGYLASFFLVLSIYDLADRPFDNSVSAALSLRVELAHGFQIIIWLGAGLIIAGVSMLLYNRHVTKRKPIK